MNRPGKAWIRVALSASLLAVALIAPAKASTAGPTIVHNPVLYALKGQSIGITAFALCDQSPSGCVATIFYRTSQPGAPAEVLTQADPSWASLTMNRDPGIFLGTQTLYSFAVQLPGTVADTRGVDYILKVTDGSAVSYSPGTAGLQGSGLPHGYRSTAYHVYVTNPGNVVSVPVATSSYRTAIPVAAYASCSGPCTAWLWYRRTGLVQPSALGFADPPVNGSDGDTQWTSVVMSRAPTGGVQNPTLDQNGATQWTFNAQIPAAYVDTRGVDYAIKVWDGYTTTWWPGTPYVGYVSPGDGLRITWNHVHVINPIIAAHTQTAYSTTAGTPLALSVSALCWTPNCVNPSAATASVQYHSYGGPLVTTGMPIQAVTAIGGAYIVTFAVTIPGSAVMVPTFSYHFRVFDGYTTAYSPGTVYNGHYVKQDGLSEGEYTVLVP